MAQSISAMRSRSSFRRGTSETEPALNGDAPHHHGVGVRQGLANFPYPFPGHMGGAHNKIKSQSISAMRSRSSFRRGTSETEPALNAEAPYGLPLFRAGISPGRRGHITRLNVFGAPLRRCAAARPCSAPRAVEPILVLPVPHSATIKAAFGKSPFPALIRLKRTVLTV